MFNAKKVTNWLLEYPVTVFAIFYTYWLVVIPAGLLLWGFILLGAYLLVTVLAKFADRNEISAFAALALTCLVAVPAIPYTLLAISLLPDYGIENITSGFVLLIGTVTIVISAYKKLSTDDKPIAKIVFICALPLMLLNVLFFSIHYPTIDDTVFFQGKRYHIVSVTDDDFHSHQTFYQCNWFGFHCQPLYGSSGYKDAKIITDGYQNEISLFDRSGLRYTYGLQPRYYEGYPVQSGNQIYELGWYCNEGSALDCEQVGYVLYQCNLEYTGCQPLPIRYTSYYDDYSLELGEDEETGEILLFDSSDEPRTILFAYGEAPRCYVAGCEILEK